MTPKTVSFDVLGTCFHFTGAISTIEARVGPALRAANVDAKTLFFSWFYGAQRDFTYNAMVDNYTPIAMVLQKTFKRACLVVDVDVSGLKDDDIAGSLFPFSVDWFLSFCFVLWCVIGLIADRRVEIMKAVKNLEARPGLKKCYDGLRENGWDVYAVTNGGHETSLGYYKKANIELANDHCLSCDDIKKAKPDLEVYENAKRFLIKGGCDGSQRWFVAAHAWDLIGESFLLPL